jgi:hypothetical protein
VNGYEILAAVILGLAALTLIIWVPAMRKEAKAEEFDSHAGDVLATHKADVRNRNLEANKAARWQG